MRLKENRVAEQDETGTKRRQRKISRFDCNLRRINESTFIFRLQIHRKKSVKQMTHNKLWEY